MSDDRPVGSRCMTCAMCGATVFAFTIASPTEGSPEMLQVATLGAWIGMVADPEQTGITIVCCSQRCVQQLLKD